MDKVRAVHVKLTTLAFESCARV